MHRCRAKQHQLHRVLARIDRHLGSVSERPAAIAVPETTSHLDLRDAGIETVIWATGVRRSYPWLHVPVLDGRGEILHHGGVTPAPGLYTLGLQFMRRRKSSFIDGVGDDARQRPSLLSQRIHFSDTDAEWTVPARALHSRITGHQGIGLLLRLVTTNSKHRELGRVSERR